MYNKKVKAIFVMLVVLVCAFAMLSCGKKGRQLKFEYTVDDNDNIHITGLAQESESFAKVTIPSTLDGKSVVAIERGAFRDNGYIQEVIIEDGITTIGENAFYNCYYLDKITFPASVETVGTNIIKGTVYEKNKLSEGNEIIVNDILIAVKNDVTKYSIPDGVKVIAPGTFYCYTSLVEVTIPESVVSVENFAFSGCTGLTQLKLPNSLKNIGYGAFYGCTNLSLTIPESVETVKRDSCFDIKSLSYNGKLDGAPWGAKEDK